MKPAACKQCKGFCATNREAAAQMRGDVAKLRERLATGPKIESLYVDAFRLGWLEASINGVLAAEAGLCGKCFQNTQARAA